MNTFTDQDCSAQPLGLAVKRVIIRLIGQSETKECRDGRIQSAINGGIIDHDEAQALRVEGGQ